MAMVEWKALVNVWPSGRAIEKRITAGGDDNGLNAQIVAPAAAAIRSNATATNNGVFERDGAGGDVSLESCPLLLKTGSLNTNFAADISARRFARSFARHR